MVGFADFHPDRRMALQFDLPAYAEYSRSEQVRGPAGEASLTRLERGAVSSGA